VDGEEDYLGGNVDDPSFFSRASFAISQDILLLVLSIKQNKQALHQQQQLRKLGNIITT
jgi:hypothetical protein